MSLPLCLALALSPQAPRTPLRPEPDAVEPYLFYDYLENGELRGGRVTIDPSNPLHVSIGPERRSTGSPVTTLVDNGPTANRIDIVFVGDGYTSTQLGQYAADVDSVWPAFFAESPISVYASYFNVHRVDVVSAQSGVDNDPSQGIQRDTALDMGYWCSGIQRLLCVDVAKAGNEANNAPDKDTVLALANSSTYGGAGYTDLGTLAGHNGSAIEIALHEFGHSFARLADEYNYGGPTTYTGPEPTQANVSTLDEAGLIAQHKKWVLWLDLPAFGAFEGAMYSQFGLYRPTFNSKMRNLGRPFQEFNSERFIRYIYGTVRPIDDATPEGVYGLTDSFFVDPVDPVGHSLDVQWSLDGAPIPGATATTFDAATLGLGAGVHLLSVQVVDNTPMVRSLSVRANWMTEERSWILGDGKKAARHPGPSGIDGPVLAFLSAPSGLGQLEFELEAGLEGLDRAMIPVLWIATSPEATARWPRGVLGQELLARSLGGVWSDPSRPFRMQLVLPAEASLADRKLYAQAALVPVGGGRPIPSNVIEFVLEP